MAHKQIEDHHPCLCGKTLPSHAAWGGSCGIVFIWTVAIMFTVGTLILLITSLVFYKNSLSVSFWQRLSFSCHYPSVMTPCDSTALNEKVLRVCRKECLRTCSSSLFTACAWKQECQPKHHDVNVFRNHSPSGRTALDTKWAHYRKVAPHLLASITSKRIILCVQWRFRTILDLVCLGWLTNWKIEKCVQNFSQKTGT